MISRSALAAGASAAVAAGGRVADLRRDAWGHGVLAVAQAVVLAGAERVRVDGPGVRDALALEGIPASLDDEPDIESALLYGLPPRDGAGTLRPVMRLHGRVLSTKHLHPGDAVSYGYTFRAARETTVALVTGGYAQGILRALGNRASVEIDGMLRPIIGRVAMDVCVVDLEGASTDLGVEATYFGGTGPASSALAQWSAVTGLEAAELVAVAGAHAERGWES